MIMYWKKYYGRTCCSFGSVHALIDGRQIIKKEWRSYPILSLLLQYLINREWFEPTRISFVFAANVVRAFQYVTPCGRQTPEPMKKSLTLFPQSAVVLRESEPQRMYNKCSITTQTAVSFFQLSFFWTGCRGKKISPKFRSSPLL